MTSPAARLGLSGASVHSEPARATGSRHHGNGTARNRGCPRALALSSGRVCCRRCVYLCVCVCDPEKSIRASETWQLAAMRLTAPSHHGGESSTRRRPRPKSRFVLSILASNMSERRLATVTRATQNKGNATPGPTRWWETCTHTHIESEFTDVCCVVLCQAVWCPVVMVSCRIVLCHVAEWLCGAVHAQILLVW